MKLRVFDIFSGIGGFSLGLERTNGFETVAFCEIDEFCRRVLAKHWPKVPCYHDVRELTAARLAADGIAVDVICGGFPCQDISVAGSRRGLDGERSGLWAQYARIVSEIRPQFVIVENTAGLLSLGMDAVLGDLSAIGYDSEWHAIPAVAVDAPHIRDRLWVVAYPERSRHRQLLQQIGQCGREVEADAWCNGEIRPVADDDCFPAIGTAIARQERHSWPSEPNVGRVVHGLPNRAHRIRALGNSVVPSIPELIGNAILASQRAA